jgi:hypothetical protein
MAARSHQPASLYARLPAAVAPSPHSHASRKRPFGDVDAPDLASADATDPRRRQLGPASTSGAGRAFEAVRYNLRTCVTWASAGNAPLIHGYTIRHPLIGFFERFDSGRDGEVRSGAPPPPPCVRNHISIPVSHQPPRWTALGRAGARVHRLRIRPELRAAGGDAPVPRRRGRPVARLRDVVGCPGRRPAEGDTTRARHQGGFTGSQGLQVYMRLICHFTCDTNVRRR